jgi:hypothetical protein
LTKLNFITIIAITEEDVMKVLLANDDGTIVAVYQDTDFFEGELVEALESDIDVYTKRGTLAAPVWMKDEEENGEDEVEKEYDYQDRE